MSDIVGRHQKTAAAIEGSGTAVPDLAVIVPSFNERGNIELLYEKLAVALKDIPFEMIVVDDDSPDGTAALTRELAQVYPNIRCIRRYGRRGLASACVEGMAATAAPFLAVIDADLQHDERILPQMLEQAKDGADLVVGSRFAGKGSAAGGLSRTRQRGSELATRLAGLVVGQSVCDPMSGFFLMPRRTFDAVASQLNKDGFKILLDLVATSRRQGRKLSIAEVPYTFRPRHAGESKMSPLIVVQYLGLWLSQMTGGVLPTTFLLFAMVGATGIFVHMAMLGLATGPLGLPFVPAQVIATLVAMTSNFFLNNVLTYADRRLHGAKFWLGLMGFYVICSLGGIANISVASMVYDLRHQTFVSGLAGAVMSSVFNYAVTRVFTWR
ncbi:glycosyltransferase [Devosia nitrariae]|uniref:Dolichol monophosphate mannose synthase n=1 Tax=Devosia nitrariae TaxID=2071872 RepID=A0ABQ5W3F9_9HYPH|nr:glycosyltransferase family 2 protein [Devosia nitrariae]GLQ54507.1 dolichol monophosphate mannose synthase [Devosia nitrariae]